VRERWQVVAFIVAWVVALAAVWTAASAVIPRRSVVTHPVAVSLVVEGPDWTILYAALTSNATAFGLLREASVAEEFGLNWVDYGWPYEDVYVMSINGAHEGDGGRSWQYCVNGAYALVGSMHQSLDHADVVRWVFALPGGDELCT